MRLGDSVNVSKGRFYTAGGYRPVRLLVLSASLTFSPAIGSLFEDGEPLNRQIITSKANFGKLSKLDGVVA